MSVTLGKTIKYVTVEQSTYIGDSTKLTPEEARDMANRLENLADEVEE